VSSTLPSPILVGRERELALLREHLDAALAGRGGLVLIGGEAGIGKTALAEALCREAAERGACVLIGRCYDRTETPPYGPWLDLIAQYSSTPDTPPPPAAFAHAGIVGEAASQDALIQQVRDFLRAVCRRRLVLLLLDDLHWADPASLDLLRVLVRDTPSLSLLIVATYRADELGRQHPLVPLIPTFVREARATRLDLRGLDGGAIRAFIEQRYRLQASQANALCAYLGARSDGNPFFLMELLRTLDELQALEAAGDTWSADALADLRVPHLLQQLVEGRLARLGEDTQHLLSMAAVIGQEVPLSLWATAVDDDVERILAAVEQACAARLLEALPGGARVRFVHALTRDAIYAAIFPPHRRRWHVRVAESLAGVRGGDPDLIAHHFRQAGDMRAISWLVRAAERAQRAYAYASAAARYGEALALCSDDDAPTQEQALLFCRVASSPWSPLPHRERMSYFERALYLAHEAHDTSMAAEVLYQRGFISCIRGAYRDGLTDMMGGIGAVEALSDAERTAFAGSIFAGDVLRNVNGAVVLCLAAVGRYEEARRLAESLDCRPAREGSQQRGTPFNAAYASGLGRAYASLGMPEDARRVFAQFSAMSRATVAGIWWHVQVRGAELTSLLLPYRADHPEEAYRLAEQIQHDDDEHFRGRGELPRPPDRAMYLPLLYLHGEWREARALALAMRADPMDADHLSEPNVRALGLIAYGQGDRETVWELVREKLPDGPESIPGDFSLDAALILQRLAAHLSLDALDATTARAWLEAHDRWLAWSGAVLGQSEGEALWTRYHRQGGDTARAAEHARRALTHASEPRQPLALLAAHRLRGELDTAAGCFESAARHLDTSRALADACAAPYEQALTLHALAELRAAAGDAVAAAGVLADVRAICEALGARPTLARADALAARIATTMRTPATDPTGLSARELAVLRLLAAGRTNREIAGALFVSVHTVSAHVRAILAKTGTDNRTAAAAFAREHGLA